MTWGSVRHWVDQNEFTSVLRAEDVRDSTKKQLCSLALEGAIGMVVGTSEQSMKLTPISEVIADIGLRLVSVEEEIA